MVRRLSSLEVCQAKDIPDHVIQLLSPKEMTCVVQDQNLTPQKVLLWVIHMVLSRALEKDIRNDLDPWMQTTEETKPQIQGLAETCSADHTEASSTFVVDTLQAPNLKVIKSDNSTIPEHFWNRVLIVEGDPVGMKALGTLRKAALRWWKVRIKKEFLNWFFTRYPKLRMTLANLKALDEWQCALQ